MGNHLDRCAYSWRRVLHLFVVLATVSVVPAEQLYAQIAYSVNLAVGTDTVAGQIVTDGTIGVLGPANILGWNLILSGPGVTTDLTSSGGQSGSLLVGGDLTATANNLFFNYSGTDGGYFSFQATPPGFYSGDEYWCNNTTWYGCSTGASIVPQAYNDPTAQYGTSISGNQVIGTAEGSVAPPPSLTYSGSVLFGLSNGATTGLPPCTSGDPVNCATGNLIETQVDLDVPGRGRMLSLVRTFNGLDAAAATAPDAIGFGWTHSYAEYLSIDASGNVTVHEGNGSTVPFTKTGAGFTAPAFVIASLVRSSDGDYLFTLPDQRADIFNSSGRLIAQIDRNGYQTVQAYNSSGQLVSVTDPAGRSLIFSYQANGLLSSVSDPMGRAVSYGYDASQNLASVTDAGGNVTRYGYDGSHRLTRMITPNGGVAVNVYDSNNRVVSQTDPAGRTTTFAYGTSTTTIMDGDQHVVSQTYTNNRLTALTRGVGTSAAATWTFTYDGAGNRISGTDPNNNTWNATYDTHGNLLTFADALGRTTTSTYDAQNNLLTRTDPLGVTTSYSYNSAGDLVSRSRPLTGTSQTSTWVMQYGDSIHPGDITSIIDPTGAVWKRAYDKNGDLVQRVDPDTNLWKGIYNGIGWLTSEVTPRGNAEERAASFTISTVYSPLGQIVQRTDQLGHVAKFTYDADRNLVRATDANGHMTYFSYDPDDELVKTTRSDGSVLTTSFDQAGNMIGQTDGLGSTTSYGYDALNRAIAVSDPLGRVTQFGYDGAGNLVSKTDPSNQITSMNFDAANELTGMTYSDGATPAVGFAYDLDGQRTAMKDGTGTSTYRFDSLHRLISATDGAGNSVGYTFNLRGDLTGITYPSGKQVAREFDAAGRLVSVSDWFGHKSRFLYDADGDAIGIRYGNGLMAAFEFDDADRLTTMDYGFLRFTYARNNLGQVTEVDSHGSAEQQSYTYNSINELIRSTSGNFDYDPADNLTGLYRTKLSYDAANELIKELGSVPEALTYDARGNRLSAPDKSQYHYDQANRLVKIGSGALYAYDGDGLRTGKTVSRIATHFTWDQAEGLPLLLTDGTTQFIYGHGGLPLEQIDSDGHVLWFHQDQLGSTRALTDARGRLVDRYSFDPYGQRPARDPWDWGHSALTPLLFAGQYTDQESGLQYLRARYYDSSTGQFLTRDSKTALTRSPYLYASGDPVNHVDPNGADPDTDSIVAIAYPTGSGAMDSSSVDGATVDAAAAAAGALAGADAGDWSGGSCPINPSNAVEVAGPNGPTGHRLPGRIGTDVWGELNQQILTTQQQQAPWEFNMGKLNQGPVIWEDEPSLPESPVQTTPAPPPTAKPSPTTTPVAPVIIIDSGALGSS